MAGAQRFIARRCFDGRDVGASTKNMARRSNAECIARRIRARTKMSKNGKERKVEGGRVTNKGFKRELVGSGESRRKRKGSTEDV